MLLVAFTFSMHAQEQGKIRVGFDGGLGVPNQGVGIGGDLDFRYNIKDNLNVGIKLNGGLSIKDILVDEMTNTASLTNSVITPTFHPISPT
ncbi:MAG TPA: hypothetical protein VK152_04705 [Paludibacter sp.]|nr:hypothetical protein [Paludibacter sp.]